MDGRSARRDAHDSGSATGSTPSYPPNLRFPGQATETQQSFNLSSISIPVDSSGNPLPWSRDSIIQWARQNGFKKFIPAFIQYGIEGYRFYMLKLEELREMRIPNVTMQDLIQLNAAIYRLNVACASPANRSHMTGTLRTPTLNTPPPPPHSQQQPPPRPAKSITDSSIHTISTTQYSLPPSSSQILSRPLQPLRPPRPSWTVRRDDPQPTYVRQQVQLTSNGMVARPVRIRPPSQNSESSGSPLFRPQDQSQLHRSPQPAPNASPPAPVPFSINTSRPIPVPHSQQQQQQRQRQGHLAARPNGSSPRSPYHESPVPSAERVQRFNTSGAPALLHHPEVDDLHALRSSQSTWSAGSKATQQQQQQRPPGIHILPQQQQQQPTHYIVQRIPHITSSSMTVPVRYHGSAQPYAVYYTHGTSAPATNTTYVYHGASGGNTSGTLHFPPRSYDPADDSMYGPAANRYNQQRPIGVTHFQNRPGVRGMFTESGGSPEPSRSFPSRDTLAVRPQKNNNSGAGIRRASLSPVLTALKPGNYHIANLPDHDLDDSSDSSDSSTDSQLQKRMQMMPVNNTRPPQQQQQQLQKMQPKEDVHTDPDLPRLPAAINTSLLRNDLRQGIGQCDTGDSTITPLSVVNVMPVLYTLGPGYSAHAGDDGQIDGNRTMTELPSEPQEEQNIGLKAFDDGIPSRIDELPAVSLREAADAMALFDAESIASSDQEEHRSDGLDEHFDLVENAADLDTESANGDNRSVFAVFDADEMDDSTSGPSAPSSTGTGSMPLVLDAEEIDEPDDHQQETCGAMAVFDADEIDEDNDDGRLSSRSSVVIDAYETESIFSSGDHRHDADTHQILPVSAPVLPPPIITALTDRHSELDDSADKPMAGQQQQSKSADASEAFRVKGVRHVVTFGTDFDKTAATLLSSIKDDIARKAAAGIIVSPGTTSNKPLPTAASIAAAIEHHQQKQKNKKKSNKPTDESPAATADSQTPTNKHTSRFSGLFGFGPRTQKSPATSAAASPSGGGGISGSLRVVTDFQSLRNNASSGSLANNNNNEAPSSDGKKSASPSTVSKRWRVPFRQLKSSNASTTAESTSLQSAKPGDEASDPAVVTGTTRVMRRSRYRAGTTSDIESPQTAAKVLGTVGERPYSMVENTTSSSSGAVTPTRRLFRQQQQQQQHSPGVPNVAVRGSRVFQHDSLSPVHTRVRFQKGGGSTSGSESEIISPAAMSLGRRPIQAVVGLNNGSSSLNSPATESESGSFFTAGSATPADPKPLDKADSWTLMFFNKEFVVQPTQVAGTTASTVPTDETLLDPPPTETAMEPPPPPSANELFIDSDNDEADQEKTQQGPESYDDDAGSVASSTRALPSTMRFTKGMRATLLERRPSQNIRGRPTADIIGEQLDEYFPDHDLDKPIVQSMVLSDGTGVLAPDHKYHIIVSEEESNGTQVKSPGHTYQQSADTASEKAHQEQQPANPRQETNIDDVSEPSVREMPGVGRRKSVRMLVQETRQKRRRQFRTRTPAIGSPDALDQDPLPSLPSAGSRELPLDSLAATPSPSSLSSPNVLVPDAPQPPPILRRKSTKLWGCIPEEIRPSGRRNGSNSNDIVRRALSLLRKPEPDPQAEKDIVEAAIKCNDISSVGSTRAHFVTQRARQQQREKLNDGVVSTDVLAEIQLRAITIQWIKGKLIGKGSFGNVHVAINAATGEVIAVKQIRLPKSICALTTKDKGDQKAKSQWEEAVGMMYTEVELLKDLDHENIVQLLGFEIAGGVMSMFLEYVPGGTVQSLVQQHGPLPESVVRSFLRQILAGLAYLHERGILHRDIKGANILVDETGTCKISDFGISRRTDHSSLVALLRGSNMSNSQGKIIGTVPFMAPEVARGARYTEAADIWSLGCVVVQMWSGRPPWDELQEPQVFFKLGRGKAPPVPDDLTEDGLDFCKKCFAAVPEQRLAAGQLACMDFARVPNDYEYPYHANL
ncbi:hypothetical protein H4R99_002532 [Coemansia sp. RSA 1722]|nr:hypothetical protein IWW45_001342 [Coemansia sp. RSA 485]KAJ2595703.1 hypothetical protein GGF39_003721 [Coemansia sp. RSA 1721]KAJ2602880.1 hypothetical protein H4R99_002532 [Coemansia sp. RSA 1722]